MAEHETLSGMGAIITARGRGVPGVGPPRRPRGGHRHLQRLGIDRPPAGLRGQRPLVGRRARGGPGGPLPLPDLIRRRGALPHRPLRPPGHQLGRGRGGRATSPAAAARPLPDARLARPGASTNCTSAPSTTCPAATRGSSAPPPRSCPIWSRWESTPWRSCPPPRSPPTYSWGYNPANPFAVEEAYGGSEGLMRFIDAAHAHGIAVILDVVYNHWGPGDNASVALRRVGGAGQGRHLLLRGLAGAHSLG